jgi:predicted ATPase
VVRRTSDGPTSLSIELELSLPSGNIAEYRLELQPNRYRFTVQRESLIVRSAGDRGDRIGHYEAYRGEIERASIQNPPPADEDRLYLIKASGFDPFREAYEALTVMGFYNLNPETMRALQSRGPGDLLHRDGANVASVVRRLQPEERTRLDSYLAAIVPGLVRVRALSLGPRETLVFRQKVTGENRPATFYASNMSDGTLRVTGILAAVAQLSDQQKPVTLIGIEEPETALHPAAARALMDALREASVQTQVLVTTHSPDLLDQVQMEHERLLAVSSQEGITRIASLDRASREAIRGSLFTPGELLRLDQLEPDLRDLARQEQTEDDAPTADRSNR